MASFTRELECSGKLLQIRQLYVGDVGCVVWDAALVLAKFLENPAYFSKCGGRGEKISEGVAGDFWPRKEVVDLGAGTGVAGLAAGVLGYVWSAGGSLRCILSVARPAFLGGKESCQVR
jgi:hypothetical protein